MQEIFDHQILIVGKGWIAIHEIGDNIDLDTVEHHKLKETIERGLASKNKIQLEQNDADKLFTDLCRTITLADPNKQCHEAQLRYRAILGSLHNVGIKPKVPNFWSDGFNFFPIDELLDFFHKNGWENINWVGDVDCVKCFHRDQCKFCGTGNMHGVSTEDKYYKQEKMNLTDKLLLLKVIKESSEKNIQLDNETLNHIVLLCQANGVPFSYHFEITADRKIITKDNKPILNVFNEITKQMEDNSETNEGKLCKHWIDGLCYDTDMRDKPLRDKNSCDGLLANCKNPKYMVNEMATYECPECKHKIVAISGIRITCIEHIGKESTGIQPLMMELPIPTIQDFIATTDEKEK